MKRGGGGYLVKYAIGGLVAKSCCDPTDCSLPGPSVEWVVISFSGDLPDPGIKPRSPVLQTISCSYHRSIK